jgi:anaerobic selenocysteine-containing dehydrogenase
VFEDYLLGRRDAQPKNAVWAAAICDLPADEITALARRGVHWSPARNQAALRQSSR